jgi:ComF family protein
MAQFKDHQPRTLGRALLPFLLDSLHDIYGTSRPWPQLLVPVPSHWRTRLRRGFNQAHALADMLGRATAIPVKPLVKRHGGSRLQKTLDRKTRFANLRGAFKCSFVGQGECVAVVDDVITTGATAELISECLLKAGAREVHIWALARTPKPGS